MMIAMSDATKFLVDSCIWIDHFHYNDPALMQSLLANEVVIHPSIIGEILLGSLPHRRDILAMLLTLPRTPVASDHEVVEMIESKQFYARGVGYTDCHLLAALFITPTTKLWTRDKRLASVAREHGLLFETAH